MRNAVRSAARIVFVCLLLCVLLGRQSPGQQTPQTAPPQTAPPQTAAPQTPPQATQQPPAPAPAPPKPSPAEEAYTGDGFSVTLMYWMSMGHPTLITGHGDTNTDPSDLDTLGKSKASPNAIVSFPIGKDATLRVSYFRMQGDGNSTAPQALTIFGTDYLLGDYLATSYTMQNAKVSLDYLSWPFPVKNAKFRLKTLWEVQYTLITSTVGAPLRFGETDAAGNPIQTTGYGSHSIVYPSFGLGIDYLVSKNFRFEARASGFAFPHRSTIWDTEASLNYRFGHLELQAGGKVFHLKTSPEASEYFRATFSGVFAGLRWYSKATTR